MNLALGSRLAAGVLGLIGGALALLIGLVLLLFGGIIDVLDANNGNSVALSGFLATVFALGAIGAACLFFLPWAKAAVVAMAFDIAFLVWAFARVDAWALALIPVAPLACSILFGLAAAARSEGGPA